MLMIKNNTGELQRCYNLKVREILLNEMDYKIIRFKNEEVMDKIEWCLSEIGKVVK